MHRGLLIIALITFSFKNIIVSIDIMKQLDVDVSPPASVTSLFLCFSYRLLAIREVSFFTGRGGLSV